MPLKPWAPLVLSWLFSSSCCGLKCNQYLNYDAELGQIFWGHFKGLIFKQCSSFISW